MRIGHGFDVHGFEAGDALMLGGVSIPYSKKFKAHSDGDVLIHAVSDALLGAAALGDIGLYFPDTDALFKNIDSRKLLKQVVELLHARHFRVGNIDATIVAQTPKMAPHLKQMRVNLADDIGISFDQINIKATTTEGLGFVGRGEGIAVHAVCILVED